MPILFFTCANKPYEDFIPLYAFSVLHHVADSKVEFGVEDVESFRKEHGKAMDLVCATYGQDSVRIRSVPWATASGSRILPNTVRFINAPETRADYVYIGDVDIIVLDTNLVSHHLESMRQTGLPYCNSVRPNTKRMSGLHFSRMDAYYPLPDIGDLDLAYTNDEALLYLLVERKGLPIIHDRWYRPIHGIHISPNRSMLKTRDANGAVRPGWGVEANKKSWLTLNGDENFKHLRTMLSVRIQGFLAQIDGVVGNQASIASTTSQVGATPKPAENPMVTVMQKPRSKPQETKSGKASTSPLVEL